MTKTCLTMRTNERSVIHRMQYHEVKSQKITVSSVFSEMEGSFSNAGMQTRCLQRFDALTYTYQNCALIVSGGGVKKIVDLMRSYKLNRVIQEKGFSILYSILRANEEVMSELNRYEFIPIILTALELHKTDVDLQVEVFEFIAKFRLVRGFHKEFLRYGGLRSFLGVISSNPTNRDLHVRGMRIVNSYASDRFNAESLYNYGAVQLCLYMLKLYPSAIEELQCDCVSVIGYIAKWNRWGNVIHSMLEMGVIEIVLESRRSLMLSSSEILQPPWWFMIERISCTREGLHRVLALGVMKLVVDNIHMDLSTRKVPNSCCRVFDAMVQFRTGRTAFIYDGGVDTIMACLKTFIRKKDRFQNEQPRGMFFVYDFLKQCCRTLLCCSEDDDSNVKIMDLGGVVLLRKMMEYYADDVDLVNMGGKLLQMFEITQLNLENKNIAFASGMKRDDGQNHVARLEQNLVWKIMEMADPSKPASGRNHGGDNMLHNPVYPGVEVGCIFEF